MWKKLVEESVRKAPIRVVDLDLEAGTISYSRRIRQHQSLTRIDQSTELVRADLVNRFVNEMGYAPEQIELDRPYRVSVSDDADITITLTVDVVVRGEDGTPFFFAQVKTPIDFDHEMEAAPNLFRLAEAEEQATGTVVQHLFYYTVRVRNGELAGESYLINYRHYRDGTTGFEPKKDERGGPIPRLRRITMARGPQNYGRELVVCRYRNRMYPVFIRRTPNF